MKRMTAFFHRFVALGLCGIYGINCAYFVLCTSPCHMNCLGGLVVKHPLIEQQAFGSLPTFSGQVIPGTLSGCVQVMENWKSHGI